jgi:hypothetical protein
MNGVGAEHGRRQGWIQEHETREECLPPVEAAGTAAARPVYASITQSAEAGNALGHAAVREIALAPEAPGVRTFITGTAGVSPASLANSEALWLVIS